MESSQDQKPCQWVALSVCVCSVNLKLIIGIMMGEAIDVPEKKGEVASQSWAN